MTLVDRPGCNRRTDFLSLFAFLFGLFSPLKALGQLKLGLAIARDRVQTCTHHARLELRWFSIKHIRRLDAVLSNTNSPIEEAHKVTRLRCQYRSCRRDNTRPIPCCLACLVGQQLTVLLAHGNEELVDAHGRIDSDFAAEQSLDFMLLEMRSKVSNLGRHRTRAQGIFAAEALLTGIGGTIDVLLVAKALRRSVGGCSELLSGSKVYSHAYQNKIPASKPVNEP